jgi:hypothetical protein
MQTHRYTKIKFAIVACCLFLTASVNAKDIQVKTITLHVEDSFTETKVESYSLYAQNGDIQILLVAPDDVNLENVGISKLFKVMDTIYFNISEYTLLKTKSEWFFQWTKDYRTKFYQKAADNRIITHTFYTDMKHPYCLLAGYKTDEEEEQILKIIDSMEFNQTAWEKIVSAYDSASWWWIIFMIIISLAGLVVRVGGADKSSALLIFLVIAFLAALILFLTCGGFNTVFIAAIIVATALFWVAYFFSVVLSLDFGD